MPTCCQGATCACKVSAVDGGHLVVSGSGQANDPFLLSADVDLGVVDNLIFDMTLNGTGIEADPWLLSVNFAATARLADFPDVVRLSRYHRSGAGLERHPVGTPGTHHRRRRVRQPRPLPGR